MKNQIIPSEIIENKIFLVRGKKIMFDKDLARLYRVETRDLNKAVKRNIERFPEDFMFQLKKGRTAKFDVPFWNIKRISFIPKLLLDGIG